MISFTDEASIQTLRSARRRMSSSTLDIDGAVGQAARKLALGAVAETAPYVVAAATRTGDAVEGDTRAGLKFVVGFCEKPLGRGRGGRLVVVSYADARSAGLPTFWLS